MKTAEPIPKHRVQTLGEEIANAISHGAGALAAIIGAPFLVVTALHHGDSAWVVGVCVFALTAMALYLSSAIYHALPRGRTKEIFEVIDHGAIFLLIAGTYTPFTLGALRGPMGWTLFGTIWGLALVGVVLKSIHGVAYPKLSVALYVAMGWLILIAARSLWLHVPLPGLIWLAAGGLAYTGGVVFYLAKWIPYGHLIWHLFVLTGTVCHYFAVLWYSA